MSTALLSVTANGLLLVATVLSYRIRQRPIGNPQYVALGSSFAAGIGLGPRAPGSPLVCMRSINGYPQQLARLRGLSLVDATCSGATAKHVLQGGQLFLGPQLDALGKGTELVTMTVGGNDVRYVGDLSLLAARGSPSLFGWAIRRSWKGPLSAERRDFDELHAKLLAILAEVRRRSPEARIVVLTYPLILPPAGSCPKLHITEEQAAEMRNVGDRLADVTRSVARDANALLIDMHALGAEHHACSAVPWVNGWLEPAGTQFHPTLEGSRAMAAAISAALDAAPNPPAEFES